MLQDIATYAMDLEGAAGALTGTDEEAARGQFQQMLLSSPSTRIAGGTDEILRNIIAERVLGLPGDIRKLSPYAAYDAVDFLVPIEPQGDGYARLRVLFREAEQSASIIAQAFDCGSGVRVSWPVPRPIVRNSGPLGSSRRPAPSRYPVRYSSRLWWHGIAWRLPPFSRSRTQSRRFCV